MIYPSIQKYTVSLLSFTKTLMDKELQQGKLKKTPLGSPLALSGNFALTYQIETANKKFAVRCFHKYSEKLEERYTAISRKISAINSKYFVDFKFQKEGILVDGSLYPIVKMEWAKGSSLAEFVSENYRSASCMANLRNSLTDLALYLEENNIAHGDIQPGNVMVADDGKAVQLVDYDGMYVDEIASLGASETGHRNFQHPERNQEIWNASLDRFSFIQLYISLKALEIEPSIWTETRSDADALLFRANDLVDPEDSDTFEKLKDIKGLGNELDKFESICLGDIDDIPSLNEFLGGSVHVGKSVAQPTRRSTSIGRYLGAYPVINGNEYSSCIEYVGERVELVARIYDVKLSWTKFHQRYAFINFGDWKGECVKLTIWGNVLKKFDEDPDDSWKGQWLSITGFMEPPFSKKTSKNNYTHLSINVTDPTEIHFIDKDEAYYKLGISEDNNSSASIKLIDECSQPETKQFSNLPENDINKPWRDNNLSILERIKKLLGK